MELYDDGLPCEVVEDYIIVMEEETRKVREDMKK